MPPSQTGRQPFGVCYPCLFFGVTVGLAWSTVVVAWLLVANRDRSLQAFAQERNMVAAAILGVLMLLPILRFVKSPGRVFFSGLVGWGIVSATYGALATRFLNLSGRMGMFHLFVLGTLAFALEGVFVWIIRLGLLARHQPLVPSRRLTPRGR